MKLLKTLLTTTLLLLLTSALYGKGLKVKVIAFGEPLAHSYIYINGVIHTTASDKGVASISLSKLEIGDIIRASFVGHKSVEAVFDVKTKTANLLTLDMSNNFMIDEINVKSKRGANPVRIYKKMHKNYISSLIFGPFILDFDIDYQSDSLTYSCSGSTSLSYWYVNRGTKNLYNIYKTDNFKAAGCDTARVKLFIAQAYFQINCRIDEFDKMFRKYHKHKYKITYKGIIGDYKAFALSYDDEKESIQYIYYYDKVTGDVKKGELIIIQKHSDDLVKYRATFDLVEAHNKNHAFGSNVRIECSGNNFKYSVKIDNVKLGESKYGKKEYRSNDLIDITGYERLFK